MPVRPEASRSDFAGELRGAVPLGIVWMAFYIVLLGHSLSAFHRPALLVAEAAGHGTLALSAGRKP